MHALRRRLLCVIPLFGIGLGFTGESRTSRAQEPPAKAGTGADPFKPSDPKLAEAVKWLDEQAASSGFPLPQDAARMKATREARLASIRKGLPEAFDRVGNTKAPWAAQAKTALELRAQYLAAHTSADANLALEPPMYQALETAMTAGCDDPMVRYFWFKERRRKGLIGTEEYLRESTLAIEALFASGYPDNRKLYAAHNAYVDLKAEGKSAAEIKAVKIWNERFWEIFDRCCKDSDPMVQDDLADIVALRETTGLNDKSRTRQQNHDEIVSHLEKANAPKSTQLLVKGRYLIVHAWEARGSGFASSVTPQGQKDFHERLTAAKAALTEAWELEKLRADAPTEMLTVCMGLDGNRDEMEKWFSRAMAADPDNAKACIRKLEFLRPRWHGSMEEYLGFGWQCIRTRNAVGHLIWTPLLSMLAEAPVLGPQFPFEQEGLRKYYAQPIIWQQVAAACELSLAEYPDDKFVQSLYARVACVAGRYDVANLLFEKIGDRYWKGVYSTRQEYEMFRKWAKDKAPPPPMQ